MATPDPDQDPVTQRFEPIPADQLPPASAAPEPAPVTAPAFAPPVPPTAFAAPEPDGIPTQPVIAGTPVLAAPASDARASRPGGSTRVLNLVLGVAVLVAVAGVSFAVGRTSAPAATGPVSATGTSPNLNANGAGPLTGRDPNASFDPAGNGPGDQDGDRGFGRPFGIGGLGIEGTVQSVDGDSVTIRTADGATITVGIDRSTQYHQQADAEASDVQAGKTVIITLADGFRPGRGANANGSITLGNAGSITVVP